MAILELQKIVPSGNLRSALHLLGSFLPADVLSKSSKICFTSGAAFTALLKGTPSTWPNDDDGGLNAILCRFVVALQLVLIDPIQQ
jgi:hypothetical protein